ncbi:MAG: hypothetical protein AAFV25_25100, partial [Bacteroidota bacterium]
DICKFVEAALDDAITILNFEHSNLGTEGKSEPLGLFSRREMSLFSCRPDLMVVRDRKRQCWLAVEVKQPLKEEETLTNFPKVLGQVYDQALAIQAFAWGKPLVVASTFAESRLCSPFPCLLQCNQDSDQNKARATPPASPNEDGHFDYSQTPPVLMSPKQVEDTAEGTTEKSPLPELITPGIHKVPSAASPSNSLSSTSRQDYSSPSDRRYPDANTFKSNCFTSASRGKGRKLYVSNPYKSHQLVCLFYSALKLAEGNRMRNPSIAKINHGCTYRFSRVLKVMDTKGDSSSKYCWGTLTATIGKQIDCQEEGARRQPMHVEKCFFIVQILGWGRTSNVFLALTPNGSQVALKLYVKNTDENGDKFCKAGFSKRAEETTKREAEQLQDIYRFNESEVYQGRIFGLWCVVMPFFRPVCKSERNQKMTDIERVFGEFKRVGKKYKADDVRWRHVGLHGVGAEERTILYDVADLEELADAEKDTFVADQCNMLRKRIGTEDEAEAPYKITASEV